MTARPDSFAAIRLEMKAHRAMGNRIAELDEWASRIAALEASPGCVVVPDWSSPLMRYGRHDADCAMRHDSMHKPKPTCTCGLDEALAAAPKASAPVEGCTEPNRDACPRMCLDFCNADEEQADPAPPVAVSAPDWDADLSPAAHDWMATLGNFGPTVHADRGQIKGYMIGDDGDSGKVYWDAAMLRDLSGACNEVADWLERRALLREGPAGQEGAG